MFGYFEIQGHLYKIPLLLFPRIFTFSSHRKRSSASPSLLWRKARSRVYFILMSTWTKLSYWNILKTTFNLIKRNMSIMPYAHCLFYCTTILLCRFQFTNMYVNFRCKAEKWRSRWRLWLGEPQLQGCPNLIISMEDS